MGTVKESMKPTTPEGNKLLGLFKKKKPELKPPMRTFADHFYDAYQVLEKILSAGNKVLLPTFHNSLKQAENVLITLIDIKNIELSNENGRESYNKLALFRLEEMHRHIQTIVFVLDEPFVDQPSNLQLVHLLMGYVAEIGAEYAEG